MSQCQESMIGDNFINQTIKDPYGIRQYMIILQGSACAIKTEAAAEINVCTEATKAAKTINNSDDIPNQKKKHPKISEDFLFS